MMVPLVVCSVMGPFHGGEGCEARFCFITYTLPAGDGPFAEATGGFRTWPFSEQLLCLWVSTCRRYLNFGYQYKRTECSGEDICREQFSEAERAKV